jgi:hypothetical protein
VGAFGRAKKLVCRVRTERAESYDRQEQSTSDPDRRKRSQSYDRREQIEYYERAKQIARVYCFMLDGVNQSSRHDVYAVGNDTDRKDADEDYKIFKTGT